MLLGKDSGILDWWIILRWFSGALWSIQLKHVKLISSLQGGLKTELFVGLFSVLLPQNNRLASSYFWPVSIMWSGAMLFFIVWLLLTFVRKLLNNPVIDHICTAHNSRQYLQLGMITFFFFFTDNKGIHLDLGCLLFKCDPCLFTE